MALLTHIVSSLIGMAGSYTAGYFVFSAAKNSLPVVSKKISQMVYIELAGLVGCVISGYFLFWKNPQEFLSSGKFLSNITIIGILIVIEIFWFIIKKPGQIILNRTASVFSWSWIFLAAMLNPPFAYLYFLIAYSITLFALLYFISRKIKRAGPDFVSVPPIGGT